jgi:hypothetical protein
MKSFIPAYRFAAEIGGSPSTDKVTYGTEAGQFAAAGIDAAVCGPQRPESCPSPPAHRATLRDEAGSRPVSGRFVD